MGKKGTKRKTSWRTLSITDSVDDSNSPANVSTEKNTEGASSKDDKFQSSSYLRRKPFYSSSANVRNDSRGDYSRNYYKQNSALSSSSSYSSRNSYHRRPFQNTASRFFSYRTGRSTSSQTYRSSDANKENSHSRPLFNEEEYTRITTPRQDVIFKKGYLSQPRKYLSSTDTNTTSSAAASVVSTEESISAASVPSLSPEQCSSYASDCVDPEQAFMYSYFDQNGVFYVNPCLPNGFDQYTGQMFMLPYSYPPYSVYPPDLNSPLQSTDVEGNTTSTDSNENLSDKETNIKKATDEEVVNNCDSQSEPTDSEKKPTVNNSEVNTDENVTENSEHPEITNTPLENFYNCGYPPFYPPVFFPYVYGQQFMPVMGAEYDTYGECTAENSEDDSKCQKEKRTRLNSDANSTGSTTVDCSKEDCKDIVEDACDVAVEEASCDTVIELKPACNQETEKKITFNANAEEFIPRTLKPHLNVNVKEFLPINCKSDESAVCSSENDSLNSILETKDDNPLKVSTISKAQEKQISIQQPKSQRERRVKEKQIPTSPVENGTETPPKLTLAERIKKGLTKEIKEIVLPEKKSSPPKTNSTNFVNNKKNPKRIERRVANEKTSLSFAQMLTKSNPKVNKTAPSPTGVVSINNNDKIPAKDTAKLIVPTTQLNKIQSQTTAEKIAAEDEWRTVKPKGKRRLFKENVLPAEEPESDNARSCNKKEEDIAEKVAVISEKVIETIETVQEHPVIGTTMLASEGVAENSTPSEVSNANIPASDQVDDADNSKSLQNSEKKVKNRNKKQKKSPNSTKKTKEREILKELGNKSSEKTDQKLKNNSKSLEVKDLNKTTTRPVLIMSESSEEDLTLDNLYLLDRKNYLLTKNFCRNPLEILNGFDCKFKGNNGILKEEEEMVLNVIKSLSTSQAKQQENKSPSQDSEGEKVNLDNSFESENSTLSDAVKVDDINGSFEENIDIAGAAESAQCNLDENIFNGYTSECAEVDNNYTDQQEDNEEEDTVVQALPEDVTSLVNGKISDAESVSDLSSDDFGRSGSEKSLGTKGDFDNLEQKNGSSSEIHSEEKCEGETVSNDYLSTEDNKLENVESMNECNKTNGEVHDTHYNDETNDGKDMTTALESLVPSDLHFDKDETSAYANCENIDSTATNNDIALLLQNSTDIIASSDVNNSEIESEDCNESDLFHIEMIKFNHCDEKLDIKAIFEEKIKEIDEQLKHASSNKSCMLKDVKEEPLVLEESLPKEPCQTEVLELVIETTKLENSLLSPETLSTEEISKETLCPIEPTNKIDEDELGCNQHIEDEILMKTCITTTPTESNAADITETKSSSSLCALEVCQSDNDKTLGKVTTIEKLSDEEVIPEPVLENSNSIPDYVEIPAEILEPENRNQNESGNCNYVEICSVALKDDISCCVDSDCGISCTLNENSEDSEQNSLSNSFANNSGSDTITTESEERQSCNISGHLDETSTSDYHSSTETQDSKETFLKDDCSDKTDITSTVSLETTPESMDNLSKYPLTMAVKQWLTTEVKEITPEPIFRVPNDPKLNSIITSSIMEQAESGTWTSDESDDEDNTVKRPKNLQSNPSHVSSVNSLSHQNDNDSDYNSDSQQRYDDDDNTCERVAIKTSDINRVERCDLLDYWDDEFIRDPKKWLDSKRCTSEENESMLSMTPSEQLTPYESLYGKSIDYNQLLASNYEFLSNNILSFSGSSPNGKTEKKTCDVGEMTNDGTTWLNDNNFGNVNRCLKAPEVCCIIM